MYRSIDARSRRFSAGSGETGSAVRRMRDRVRAEEVRAGELREAERRGRRFIRRIAAIVAVGVPDARHRHRRDRIPRRHLQDARVERLESRDETWFCLDAMNVSKSSPRRWTSLRVWAG